MQKRVVQFVLGYGIWIALGVALAYYLHKSHLDPALLRAAGNSTTYVTVKDGNWSDPSVWNPTIPPDPIGSGVEVIINHIVNADLEIEVDGGSLTIASGAQLNVEEEVEVKSNGTLIVEQGGGLSTTDLEVKEEGSVSISGTVSVSEELEIQDAGTYVEITPSGALCLIGASEFDLKEGARLVNNGHLGISLTQAGNAVIQDDALLDNGGTARIEPDLILDQAKILGRNGILCTQVLYNQGSIGGTLDVCQCVGGNNPITGSGSVQPTVTICTQSIPPDVCGSVFSVTFAKIDAILQENGNVIVSWQVAAESDIMLYEIERAVGSPQSWQSVGNVGAKGIPSATYTFEDINPPKQVLYYRIKAMQSDGSFLYSSTVVVKAVKAATLKVYPSPATNFIQVEGLKRENGNQIVIYQLQTAQEMLRLSIESFERQPYRIDISNLPSGIYILKHGKESVRFIKQ